MLQAESPRMKATVFGCADHVPRGWGHATILCNVCYLLTRDFFPLLISIHASTRCEGRALQLWSHTLEIKCHFLPPLLHTRAKIRSSLP